MCYYVKETALRFASSEADTEAVTWFSGEWSFGRASNHVLLAKQIKLRYSASMWNISFFYTSFEASVSNVTSLLTPKATVLKLFCQE